MKHDLPIVFFVVGVVCLSAKSFAADNNRPNFILVMADDMGWGQTGYYGHPVLKTPNLDAMAASGLRFDRFYAGAPNCSPTRATVMTGRTNDRTGVTNHGVPLRPQETTIAQLLQQAGYVTGHFGKWHLNGLRGPGVPILKDDLRRPGRFGFGTWLSVTNFFDMNPIMSRGGIFEEFEGDSSEVIVDQALRFIADRATDEKPFLTVIWYGTPHSPFVAFESDREQFGDLDNGSANHYGELVAMDRSIGTLRQGLRDLGLADNTLVWFCSDNGGLPKIKPDTVGGLRGFKNSVYEGGLRVPAVIEWPQRISRPRVSKFPACTMDILPTLAELARADVPGIPLDGISLVSNFVLDPPARGKPIGFRHTGRTAFIDNDLKLVKANVSRNGRSAESSNQGFELYNLAMDAKESKNLIEDLPAEAKRMIDAWKEWNASVEASVKGRDYPEGEVIPPEPGPRRWTETDEYKPYLDRWKDRPEYRSAVRSK